LATVKKFALGGVGAKQRLQVDCKNYTLIPYLTASQDCSKIVLLLKMAYAIFFMPFF
jgi:hypothetical protein